MLRQRGPGDRSYSLHRTTPMAQLWALMPGPSTPEALLGSWPQVNTDVWFLTHKELGQSHQLEADAYPRGIAAPLPTSRRTAVARAYKRGKAVLGGKQIAIRKSLSQIVLGQASKSALSPNTTHPSVPARPLPDPKPQVCARRREPGSGSPVESPPYSAGPLQPGEGWGRRDRDPRKDRAVLLPQCYPRDHERALFRGALRRGGNRAPPASQAWGEEPTACAQGRAVAVRASRRPPRLQGGRALVANEKNPKPSPRRDKVAKAQKATPHRHPVSSAGPWQQFTSQSRGTSGLRAGSGLGGLPDEWGGVCPRMAFLLGRSRSPGTVVAQGS